MKLTTSILAMAMMAGGVAAQNPDAIDNARSAAKSLQQKQANGTKPVQVTATAKPAPGAPAPAVKPAAIPSSQPVPAAKPDSSEKPEHASAQHNQLQRVNVIPGTDQVQIEISSTEAVTPRVSKLKSPDRILVELPETVIASSQSKIPVDSAGVKGVRIGMDGKTPPTTSVVVDLEKPLAYELTPGSAGKVILTLHAQAATLSATKTSTAKTNATKNVAAPADASVKTASAAPAKASVLAPAVKIVAVTSQPTAAKPAGNATAVKTNLVKTTNVKTTNVAVVNAPTTAPGLKPDAKEQAKAVSAPKIVAPVTAGAPATKITATKITETKVTATKIDAAKISATTAKAVAPAGSASEPAADKSVSASATPKQSKPEQSKPEEKKWAMNGKRDPFFSPVVQQNGSGCSTGKKCLEIGAINLRGVVKSDSGFIAVVTNNLNKAYFLRENDPVFNGYVVKITGDSVVFQETIQDKLGKSFTREVVKRIFTPAV